MAITRPITKTIISTTNFGIPITDEVNRLTDVVNKLGTYGTIGPVNGTAMPGDEVAHAIPMIAGTFKGKNVTATANGFTITIPGRYLIICSGQFGGAAGGAYLGMNLYQGVGVTSTVLASATIGVTGFWVTCPMAHTVQIAAANTVLSFGAAHNMGSGLWTDGRGSFTVRWIGD
jgi:hypothetical protein